MALYPTPYGFNANPMQSYGMNATTPNTPQNNGIIWVQGVEGAKAYQIAPNSNVLLMDSENDGRFYIKTCDNIGMCSMRYFEYIETSASTTKTPEIDTTQFVTKTELASVINDLKEGLKHEQPVSTVEQNNRYSGKH